MNVLTAQVLTPFVAPALAWAGVALVSVPIAIHLLSRWRRKPEPWGAMRFLLEAYRKQKQRMRFEQWLLLLLRCLIIVMLGLALARPRLVGTLGQWLGGLDSRGRVVHIVIDDALSTQASDGPDTTRFDRLTDKAIAVVDSLEAGDRATLWRAARPAGPVIAEPTADRAVLRDAINQLRPGYSRPDLPTVLNAIEEKSGTATSSAEPSVTVLLGDFTRSARYIDQQAGPSGQGDEADHTLIVSRPMSGLDNYQVQSVKPRRRVVWLDGLTGNQVPAEVRVARFAENLPEATLDMTVGLFDAQGRRESSLRKQVYFPAGQGVAVVSVDLPVENVASKFDTQGGALLTIRAQLANDRGDPVFDNQAHAVVELRRQLRIAVVDEPAGVSVRDDTGLTPGQWVSLALNPQGFGPLGNVEIKSLTPAQLNDPTVLETIDAVMLMRPDRLLSPVWQGLTTFAETGGLVWVFTPAGDGSAPWVSAMLDTFKPGWQIGLEPVALDLADENPAAAWGLSSETLDAEPLERLAADWQALTQPIRIYRKLDFVTPESDAWVSLDQSIRADTVDGQQPGPVVLGHHPVGLGSLVLLSTSVDTRWTNLPTKPLFVPLIHETLRGVLGLRDRPGMVSAVAGDQPTLGEPWKGLSTLDRLAISGDLLITNADAAVGPQWTVGETGVQLVSPLTEPGVYQTTTDAGPRRLIVDPDPQAGDLRQIDEEAFTRWLDGQGDWRWLDDENPGASLQRTGEVADIGWALLWALLGLVLVETLAARYMSHASAGPGGSLTGRLWRAGIRLRSGQKSTDSQRGRAA